MLTAIFLVHGEPREMRQVADEWLERAQSSHDHLRLEDGNEYCVTDVEYDALHGIVRVALESTH